ncbi:MAG: FAD-dependent oxidoreductase [Pseudomonadota bacterium]
MKRLYDENLYRFDTPQPSYWEATAKDIDVRAEPLAGNGSCDVAIIGGGYTGLSAGLHLARDYNIDVRVLEAGHVGWGASGRNGGFCCPGGSATGLTGLVKQVGADSARAYARITEDAVNLVRDLGDAEGLEFQSYGSAEVGVAHTPKAFEVFKEDYEVARKHLGVDWEIVDADAFRDRYFDCTEQFGGLIQRPTFGLHPLRFCRGLANAALRHGAKLHEHSEVREWSKSDGMHRLTTDGGTLRAKRVIFATNGFIDESLNEHFKDRTLPIISAIIVTRPLTADERTAAGWKTEHPAYNSRRVMNYYRMLPDNRFLFGGRARSDGRASDDEATFGGLQSMLAQFWPAWANVEIEYRWQGLVCFTGSLLPSVGQLDDDPSVFFGYGYHGSGVSTATWTGKQLADWIGTGNPQGLPAMIQGIGKRFPLARMRTRYLRAGIAFSGWLDRRG